MTVGEQKAERLRAEKAAEARRGLEEDDVSIHPRSSAREYRK